MKLRRVEAMLEGDAIVRELVATALVVIEKLGGGGCVKKRAYGL